MMHRKWVIPSVVAILVLGMLALFWSSHPVYSRESVLEPAQPAAAPISVEVANPERKQITRSLILPGSFFALEEATLYAKVAGYLKSISVDIGDRVNRGQVVAVLDVPELTAEHESAKAELVKARAALQRAQADLLRCKADLGLKQLTLDRLTEARKMEPEAIALHEVDSARAESEMSVATAKVTEGEIEIARAEVEAVKAQLARLSQMLKYTRIVAPLSGFVTRRYVHPGALIPQGSSGSQSQPVVALARTDVLRFHCEVPEPEVRFFIPGKTRVVIRVDALPEKVFEAKVARIAGALNDKTRTMLTEVQVANPGGLLKPGMYASAEFLLESNPNVLVVPAAALLMESGSPYVLRIDGTKVAKVGVRTGADDGIQVEMVEGVRESDSIIISGKHLVRPGDTVVPHLKGGSVEES